MSRWADTGRGCRPYLEHKGSLFKYLEPELYDDVVAAATPHQLGAGETFFTEGTPALAVYCLRNGTANLSRMGERGDRQVIRLLGPADIFGLRPILAGENFACSATALVDCDLCTIPRAAILRVLERSPRFALAALKYMARELRYSEDLIMVLTQRSVRRRLADVLLLLNGHKIRDDDWDPFPMVRLKRKEIAQMIATTPETLSRTLAEFAAKGLVRLTRRDIDLVDIEGLQTVASEKYGEGC